MGGWAEARLEAAESTVTKWGQALLTFPLSLAVRRRGVAAGSARMGSRVKGCTPSSMLGGKQMVRKGQPSISALEKRGWAAGGSAAARERAPPSSKVMLSKDTFGK